jgi:chloramphenicol-sensitive protein RarD
MGYILFLGSQGQSTFGTEGGAHALLLVSTGLITAVPLICFGAAATRVSMTTIGLLQYLAPTIQFALGVFFFDEAMPPARLAGYCLVWVALVIFTFEAVTHRRRQLRLAADASAI